MNTFKSLKEFYWPDKRLFIWSIFFLIIMTILTMAYPIVLQFAIDEVVLSANWGLLPYLAGGFVVITVLKAAATYIHQYYGDLFGIRAVYRLRSRLYKKLQYLPFRFYDNAKTGDLMSRLTADVEGFRFFLSFGCAQLLNLVLLVTVSFAVMMYYSVPLALVSLAAMPFLAVAVYRFDKKVHPAFKNIRLSFASLTTKVQENVSGMSTVKSLSREDFEMGRFDGRNADYKNKSLYTSTIWAKFFPFMELIGNVCVVVLLGFGGYLVIQGQLQLGQLAASFSLIWYIIGPLINLGFIINTFSQSKASGERIVEVLEEKEDITNTAFSEPVDCLYGEIVFNHVTHTYSGETQKALEDITFHAAPGETIGLIGATGAGKTTITQLISRFYEPDEGEVLIDGRAINQYKLEDLRAHVGFVLQESFIFSSTIHDNIAYGRPDASLEEVIDAAKRAHAHEFIMELQDGYETVLGERGVGLSGGQKQRISIARAILINPAILVLDDATSAVDMETEHRIQAAFQEVMKEKTTFIIAHRISSLKHADQILVLENGKIAERGRHEELLEKEGIYKTIYDIQFQDKETVMQQQV
ncbi:ABC transporter ATP-binding protein [Alteribacillus bidgolensis]|uniref:ATP-binding cassette, subfamily B/ATP-binding cassette, subfamily B, MsbA n=1 Tax=Alteribacillus bidgolensis TaxID=930129 RepID=A0A1G8EGD4_9BACI|nr:ABC transporter ATP-binding protein [Alteribacillus bidgolensis]SDH68921.1 ATP-binding cassette, subfamily B/ATP-binding cassette, subfamily B, MsbA [Alteribacillus bidgolensis]